MSGAPYTAVPSMPQKRGRSSRTRSSTSPATSSPRASVDRMRPQPRSPRAEPLARAGPRVKKPPWWTAQIMLKASTTTHSQGVVRK